MLSSLKDKLGFGKKKGEVLGSPIEGEAIALSEVSDPTFGEEILGKGVAIVPSVGKVVAPVDGTIEMVFDTKHAISMRSESGIEILIHVGLDTVTLKGEPFEAHVAAGDKVKAGDFDTKHAISMRSESGIEILIHVGLDTVTLKGEPFEAHVAAGDKVKAGDLLLDFDIEAIKAAGLETVAPMVICNTADYSDIQAVAGKAVKPLDEVLTVTK